MMGVYIRGMEMPNVCAYCFLDASECDLHPKVNIWRERHPNCPLVEIPTPHGRLIDADKLKSRLVLDNDSNELQRISADILKWIDIQETVIEAEGETE